MFSIYLSFRESGPFILRINRSTFISFKPDRRGETRTFRTENPRSTPEVDGGIKRASLNSFIVCGCHMQAPDLHILA